MRDRPLTPGGESALLCITSVERGSSARPSLAGTEESGRENDEIFQVNDLVGIQCFYEIGLYAEHGSACVPRRHLDFDSDRIQH